MKVSSGALCAMQTIGAIALLASASDAADWLVSLDGHGDFASIQAAIDAIPDGNSSAFAIFIADGVYVEHIEIPAIKGPVTLQGESRDGAIIQWDRSDWDDLGRWSAEPVVRSFTSDLTLRGLTIKNLAAEPGGSGGKWDSALRSYGDRLILDDVRLRGDHDTLLVYGLGGVIPNGEGGRFFVRDSLIQGRGDFVASFGTGYLIGSTIETIRDRGHFVFQTGIPDAPLAEQEKLVFERCLFTGRSQDPIWPAGLTNLHWHPVVYFIDNVMEFDVGVNRPPVHFHREEQTRGAWVFHRGNASATGSLDWSVYSVPGPPGTPRVVRPIHDNDAGEPFVQQLALEHAGAVTPASILSDPDGWDPEAALPAVTTRVALALPGAPASMFSGPLRFPPQTSELEVEVFLFGDLSRLTGFAIELALDAIALTAFEFNGYIPNAKLDMNGGRLSLTADAHPLAIFSGGSSPVAIGRLTISTSAEAGQIHVSGVWVDDAAPHGSTFAIDNAGAKLAFVPEPRQWLALALGACMIRALRRSAARRREAPRFGARECARGRFEA